MSKEKCECHEWCSLDLQSSSENGHHENCDKLPESERIGVYHQLFLDGEAAYVVPESELDVSVKTEYQEGAEKVQSKVLYMLPAAFRRLPEFEGI